MPSLPFPPRASPGCTCFIDGWSQDGPTYTGPTPPIEINGAGAPGVGMSPNGIPGLIIQTPNTTIRGLVLDNFAGGDAITLAQEQHQQRETTGGGTNIYDTYIGPNLNGTTSLGNAGNGITIDGTLNPNQPKNVIGTTSFEHRPPHLPDYHVQYGGSGPSVLVNAGNPLEQIEADLNSLVSGIGGSVGVSGPATFMGTAVTQYVITFDGGSLAGMLNLTAATSFTFTAAQAPTVTLGQSFGNVISGNRANNNTNSAGDGIEIQKNSGNSVENLIQGNYIGTTAAGTAALANAGDGIFVATNTNVIGVAGDGNAVAASGGDGVSLQNGTTTNLVQGNFIGTNNNGGTGLGNTGNGVTVDSDGALGQTVIGGSLAGQGNVISGNKGWGVSLSTNSTYVEVVGNAIGTALANGTGLLSEAGYRGNKLGGVHHHRCLE